MPGSVLTSSTNGSPVVRDPQIGSRVAAAAERRVRRERVVLGALDHRRAAARAAAGTSCRCACTSPRSRRTSSRAEPRPSRARGRRGSRRTPRCPRCNPRRSPGRETARAAITAARDLRALLDDAHADRAALVRGLDDERQRRAASAATASLPSAGPSCGSSCQRGVGTPFDSKIRFDITLSIASALARMPGAGARQSQARAQALDRAVLAPRAVQRVPHHVRARVFEQAREARALFPVDRDRVPAACLAAPRARRRRC